MYSLSKTKNQHFVSQAELRLNSINPNANEKNQRIYSFEVNDREQFGINLNSYNGVNINKNSLSLNDLFSFDVLDKNDVKDEVLNLFIAKFMNFIRNPFSIEKVLNTFSLLQNVRPIIEPGKSNFERLLAGNKPQQQYLCKQLRISNQDYLKWLGTIFMLLTEFKLNQPNFMEEVIRSFFEDSNRVVSIGVFTYKSNTCVVSDRGYSIPLSEDNHMSFDFNLCSNSFIRYIFADIEELPVSQNIPKNIIQSYKSMPKKIICHPFKDDLDELEKYNQRTAYQCHQRVFSSSQENYGLTKSQ